MSTRKDFIAYLLDQINDEQAKVRAMFGEYALYYDDKVVALVCDNTLFLKMTDGTQRILGDIAETGPAYPGAKPSFVISEDILESGERLRELVRACVADLPKTKKR